MGVIQWSFPSAWHVVHAHKHLWGFHEHCLLLPRTYLLFPDSGHTSLIALIAFAAEFGG